MSDSHAKTPDAPPLEGSSRPFADARWLLWIVAGLCVWTLVLAIGAWKGPTAKPTGEALTTEESAVVRGPQASRRALQRGAIVAGSTTLFLAFWGLMFWSRARRLADGPGKFPEPIDTDSPPKPGIADR